MNLVNRAYSEKRSFIRMKIDAMVSYTIDGHPERYYDGRCKNISGAGLLIETDKKLKVGTRLNLTIPSEGNDIENLDALVEVIRINSLPEQHKYELGVVIKKVV